MNLKKDISFVFTLCKIGKYFGLTPAIHGSQNKHKWYVPLLLIVFIIGVAIVTVTFITHSDNLNKGPHAIPRIFINIVWHYSNFIYVVISLLGTQFGCNKWKALFENIDLIEKKLPQEYIDVSKISIFFNVVLMVYHLIVLMLNLISIVYAYFELYLSLLGYIMFTIVCFQFFDTCLICTFNFMLGRRYSYLRKLIKLTLKDNNLILRKQDENVLKLKNILSIYQILHKIVEQLNGIFGWKMFFILECTMLAVLNGFGHYMAMGIEIKRHFMYMIFRPLSFVIISIAIVLSCDAVEKSGKRITVTCYLKLGLLEKSILRDQLFELAQQVEELSPKMSAAGLFTVNQRLLASAFSFMATYLIIIIQFNLL